MNRIRDIAVSALLTIATVSTALALSGCETLQKIELPAGQALLIAEAATDGINHTSTVLATSGTLKGETARQVHAGVGATNECVSAAHAAYRKHDIPTTISHLNDCMKSAADVQRRTDQATGKDTPQ